MRQPRDTQNGMGYRTLIAELKETSNAATRAYAPILKLPHAQG